METFTGLASICYIFESVNEEESIFDFVILPFFLSILSSSEPTTHFMEGTKPKDKSRLFIPHVLRDRPLAKERE